MKRIYRIIVRGLPYGYETGQAYLGSTNPVVFTDLSRWSLSLFGLSGLTRDSGQAGTWGDKREAEARAAG